MKEEDKLEVEESGVRKKKTILWTLMTPLYNRKCVLGYEKTAQTELRLS